MMLRLLNWQGIAGIAASLGLAVLLFIQKAETRHWKKQSASFEQLYQQEQAAFQTTVADYRAAANRPAPPTRPIRTVSPPSRRRSTKGPPMNMRPALLLPALMLPSSLLGACASDPKPKPIPVLAETHHCPAYPLPPADLLKPPAKTDFLKPTD